VVDVGNDREVADAGDVHGARFVYQTFPLAARSVFGWVPRGGARAAVCCPCRRDGVSGGLAPGLGRGGSAPRIVSWIKVGAGDRPARSTVARSPRHAAPAAAPRRAKTPTPAPSRQHPA